MNPFINPKKRDFLLPKGCKDLADVLLSPKAKALSGAGQLSEERYRGTLQELECHIGRFLDSAKSSGALIISVSEKTVCIDVDEEGTTIALTVLLGPEEAAARTFFSEQGLQPSLRLPHVDAHSLQTGGAGKVYQISEYLVPRNVERLAQVVRDLFTKLFGVAEESEVSFAQMKF